MRDTAAPGRLSFFSLPEGPVMPKIVTAVYVKGGFPSPAQNFMEQDIDLVTYLGMNRPGTFVVRMDGNFPIEEDLPENAWFIVNADLEPVSQDLILGQLEGEYVVRSIVRSTGKSFFLYSRNPHIAPVLIKEEDQRFNRLGVITQLIIDRTITRPKICFAQSMDEVIDLFDWLGVHKPSVFIARTDGNSMKQKNIPHDSYLIVDRSLKHQAQDIVIACLNGGFTVKTLTGKEKSWKLYPGNPYDPPITVKEEDDFKIWGVVSKVIIDRKSLWKRLQ